MLAWRAGLLPPEAAADIERQIHRGKAATFLPAQVDAFSTRPPRVAMTWLAKGGVTESDVTDYLRNRLREDRLVAFEKACLEAENLPAHVVWRHRQLVEARRDSPGRSRQASTGSRFLFARVIGTIGPRLLRNRCWTHWTSSLPRNGMGFPAPSGC